jgi:serine-type D-Ala-D-Ala carboxypeptidase/endopeptidase
MSQHKFRNRINLNHHLRTNLQNHLTFQRLFWINTNRVLEHLFNNKTIVGNISSSSSIPASIEVVVITPNSTQVSAYGNISKANPTPVDGNTVFDIGSVTKTFVTTFLADLVNQGVVKLSDPLDMYLPSSNVIVPSYNGYKITLEDLATHTFGLPYWPPGWIWNKYYTTQPVYEFPSNSKLENEPKTSFNSTSLRRITSSI